MQQDKMDDAVLSLELPGFRFHPTEEELLEFYLRNVIFREKLYFDVIGFLNIYRHDPWELPALSKIGEREWYFFVPRDKKPSNGGRSSRTTPTGYWKATGSERKVVTLTDPKRVIGFRKTLVFYKGRAPRGTKTDWIMNEYRLPDNRPLPKDIVLCKVYRKATSLKVLEQWAAVEKTTTGSSTESAPQFQESYYTTSDLSNSGTPNASHYGPQEDMLKPMINCHVDDAAIWEEEEDIEMGMGSYDVDEISTSLRLPLGQVGFPELQLPKIDWAQDPLWAQLFSPLFDNVFSRTTPCANLLQEKPL